MVTSWEAGPFRSIENGHFASPPKHRKLFELHFQAHTFGTE